MEIEGTPTLFGRPINNIPTTTFHWGSDQTVRGTINKNALNAYAWLQPEGSSARLSISSLQGAVEVSLSSHASAIRFDIAGSIDIFADSLLAAQADIYATYNGNGYVTLHNLSSNDLETPNPFSFNDHALYIDGISSLEMYYSAQKGLEYRIGLQAHLDTELQEFSSMEVPLFDSELTEAGLSIPRQEAYKGTPYFTSHIFEQGGNQFELLAFRLPPTKLSVASKQAPSTNLLSPTYDFELHILKQDNHPSTLQNIPLTLQNASISGGIILGSVLPYSLIDPIEWPFQTGTYQIYTLSGSLMADKGAQSHELYYSGNMLLGHSQDQRSCEPSLLSLEQQNTHIAGISAPFKPCGPINLDGFNLEFGTSVLKVSTSENRPSFILEGELLNISGLSDDSPSLKEPGTATLDLSTKEVLAAYAEVDLLDIRFPKQNPFLEIQLQDVPLSEEGFIISEGQDLTAKSVADNQEYTFRTSDQFILSWKPEISNKGKGELVIDKAEEEQVVGYFDGNGYHPTSSYPGSELPERIALPDLVDAYLVIPNDEDIEIDQNSRDRLVLQSGSDSSFFLSIPLLNAESDELLFPVSIDLRVNDTFAYIGGSIEEEYSDDPIDLEEFGYPIRIHRIKYDPEEPLGQRLELTGELRNPFEQNDEQGNLNYLPFRGTLTPQGFVGSVSTSEQISIYPGILSLAIHDLSLENPTLGNTLRFEGALLSPLISSDDNSTYIGIEGVYSTSTSGWSYRLKNHQPDALPIGNSMFLANPNQGYSLKSDAGLELTISGRFQFPELFDPGFSLGAMIDIGRSGIELWPDDELETSQSLFGGVLSALIDDLDFEYNAEANVVIATLDGVFIPELSQANSNENQIPFSSIQISSKGQLSITGRNLLGQIDSSHVQEESLDLLQNLSPFKLVDEAFIIDSIKLVNDKHGFSLDLEGQVFLPNFGAYAPNFNMAKLNRPLPAHIKVSHEGGILENRTTWTSTVLDSLLLVNTNSDRPFKYQAVDLDFNPRSPEEAQLFATALLPIKDFVSDTNTPRVEQSSQSLPDNFSLETEKGILLGSRSNPTQHPGIIIRENQPISYLLTDIPGPEGSLFKVKGHLTDIEATHLSIDNPHQPTFTAKGRSFLNIDGFSGYFSITDMRIDPRGITDLGSLAAPSALAFQNLASFELNCLENQQNAVSSLQTHQSNGLKPSTRSGIDPIDGPYNAQIRFGTFCGSSLPLTLTDRWFAGTFDEFNLSSNDVLTNDLQINGISLQLSRIASFNGTLTYDGTGVTPYFQVDGETTYRTLALSSTGSLKRRNNLPSLSLLFSPARVPLEIIPDYGFAKIPGGGLFYRPTDSDIDLVSLVLDERSNNTYTSNHPNYRNSSDLFIGDQLSLVAPIEFVLETGNTTLDFEGVGILQDSEQFLYLDLDGALFDEPERLQTDLFLVQRPINQIDQNSSSLLFEGLSDISLNYTSIVGGIIPGNFTLTYSPESPPNWSANGYSQFTLTDTKQLPGSFLMNQSGFALTLQDTIRIEQGHFSVDDKLSVSLWYQRDQPEIEGYASFTSTVDLLPGYMLNQDNMYGALIKDRDEYQIYAARNQYADVPFVFNGPIDPWLSFQDGETYGGDARNSSFKRMLQDARTASQRISGLAAEATNTLQNALDLQNTVSQSPLAAKKLSTFSTSSAAISDLGQQLSSISERHLTPEKTPLILQTIYEELFEDEGRPEFDYTTDQIYASERTREALNQMRSSIIQARQSAELDIYSFQTISPRPLLWLADYVELVPELEVSPLQIEAASNSPKLTEIPFNADPVISRIQTRSLIAFKQNNESVDSQFLRAISGLENNLINLKTVRSPEQAFDFEIANNSIRQFYAQQIADDWEMLTWSNMRKDWLSEQESAIEKGLQEQLSAYTSLEASASILRQVAQEQYNLSLEIGKDTRWQREDLPEGSTYSAYLNNLTEDELESEFLRSAKNMWFDSPLASLNLLSDSLSKQISERIDQFNVYSDTLNKVSDSFSKALDPLYDVQTQYTTTLFGMADEYRIWRSSIRGLDPEAVDYSFQFTPYRGNYRILSEDLTPPVIKDIVVSPTTTGFLNQTLINWETEHPVELAEVSLSINEDTSSTTYFTSLATSSSTSYVTTKTDLADTEKDISLTLRVRGAGGVPVIKKGQFSVQVTSGTNEDPPEEITLIPFDQTTPPSPVISDLSYSSYFSETPNTLQFKIGALRDTDSGIERVEYKIESEDGKNLVQDWTSLPISTTYFGGRQVETSLPVQEDEITVKVSVRITNGRGLTSLSSEELELDLDVTPPQSSIKNVLYLDDFENSHPNSLGIEVIDITDQESGIDYVEYTITKEAQANLANAIWSEFISLPNRPQRTGSQTVYIPLSDHLITEGLNNLSIFIRATNGAGLQNVTRETIQVPGKDLSVPTEPSVTLEHTGFYNPTSPNRLRIIAGNSSDFESGIGKVLYRVLDGQTGQVIFDWDDFLIINPTYPTFIAPTTEKTIQLPDFDSSRPVIVEVKAVNRSGLESTKAIRFLPLELDFTPPNAPQISAKYYSAKSPLYPNSILLDIGQIIDEESPLQAVEYRIISPENQQSIQDWSRVAFSDNLTHVFPGTISIIESPILSPNVNHIIQVRSTNLQGLSNIVDLSLDVERDNTPPLAPSLELSYMEETGSTMGNLEIEIGESYDPQTFISQARYRVSDLKQLDSLLVSWQYVDIGHASTQFEGVSIQHEIPHLQPGSRYLVDVEIINGAGLSGRSSAIVDYNLIDPTQARAETSASLELFYFNSSNIIRSNQLEITISPTNNYLVEIDSLRYKIDIDNNSIIDGVDTNGTMLSGSWNSIQKPLQNASGAYQLYASLPALKETINAVVQVQLFSQGSPVINLNRTFSTTNTQDFTPPPSPDIDAIYYSPHYAERANELYLVLNDIGDPESRISSVSYRLIDKERGAEITPDWVPISIDSFSGISLPHVVSIDLPEFKESTIIGVEVQSVNGSNLTSSTEIPISVVVDTSPPTLDELDVFVRNATFHDKTDKLVIHLFGISDNESPIDSITYRVSINENTSEPLIDWTVVEHPQTKIARYPEIELDLPKKNEKYSVLVEVKAANLAGLSSRFERELEVDIDTSPPQIQQISASYKLTKSGSGYLLIEPGSFRDPESQIAEIEYRLVDAAQDSLVYMPWKSIPIQKNIRVQLNPISIPRQLLPFDASRTIAIEYRATNGAGIKEIRRTTIEIPGDSTPSEAPTLLVSHRNGYDPRHPNTIEIQIGPSKDAQSTVKSAKYRILNVATREELLPWTNLPVSNDGTFPGKVLYSELPFLSQESDMQIEVEVINSAGLIRNVSENVTIQIAGDTTPPSLAIQAHYLSKSIAVVLDELADSHSRIQRVEYRLVDNVDQSVISNWADLFEIGNPLERYTRQSYRISLPEIEQGRAVKVEVRATNGAGLQTTVSKTILYQQSESN